MAQPPLPEQVELPSEPPPALPKDAEEQGKKRELDEIIAKKAAAEKLHKPLRDMWEEQYGLYRNYRKLGGVSRYGSPPDRDQTAADRQEWGARLFIPYAFATVETLLPRMIANDPVMLVRPSQEDGRDAARAVKRLLEKQQRDISYDLKLQEVAKRACIFGLGIQKTYWKYETKKVRKLAPPTIRSADGPEWVESETEEVIFDGPMVEVVHNFDFFWDPAAKDIDTAQWVLHRTWRDQGYVERKLENQDWSPVDMDVVRAGGSSEWAKDQNGLREAAGLERGAGEDTELHEVWEFWTRDRVITVLDQRLVVSDIPNPCFHGELPFQIFRPSLDPAGNFCGIGVVEPIKHLIYEMNTTRSQRRDNASLAMQRPVGVTQGMVETEDMRWEPGAVWETTGPPNEVIFPMTIPDVPNSSYRETEEIAQDIERTTGISDAVAGAASDGGSAAANTATGMQMEQASANIRVRQMSKNLEREVIRPTCKQVLYLNQQHVRKPKTIRIEDTAERDGYRFDEITPEQIQAIELVEPDAGSTEPENEVAEEQKWATLMTALTGQQDINQRELKVRYLRAQGVSDPEQLLADPNTIPLNPQELLDQLEAGLEANLIHNGIIDPDDPEQTAALQQMVADIFEQALTEQAEDPQNQELQPEGEEEAMEVEE